MNFFKRCHYSHPVSEKLKRRTNFNPGACKMRREKAVAVQISSETIILVDNCMSSVHNGALAKVQLRSISIVQVQFSFMLSSVLSLILISLVWFGLV